MGHDVRFLAAHEADDPQLVDHVVTMVNAAYDTAERGLWKPGVTRTSTTELAEQIRRGDIAVAEHEGRIVGAVMTAFADGVGWFGGLATDSSVRGGGFASALVALVHATAIERGCSRMRIERLAPPREHPHTERVWGWYADLGYVEVSRMPFAEFEPDAAAFLLEECDVVTCERALP